SNTRYTDSRFCRISLTPTFHLSLHFSAMPLRYFSRKGFELSCQCWRLSCVLSSECAYCAARFVIFSIRLLNALRLTQVTGSMYLPRHLHQPQCLFLLKLFVQFP